MPQTLTVFVKERAQFACTTTRATWVQVVGDFEMPLPKNAKTVQVSEHLNLLTVRDVGLENNGTYICQGREENRSYFDNEAYLIVREKERESK